MGNIGYILAAGVVLGLLAFAPAFFAEKSAEVDKDNQQTDTGTMGCGFNCASCMSADSCSKAEKEMHR